MKQLLKDKIIYLLKFCVGIILIVWILNQVDGEKFAEYFMLLTPATIVLIVLFSLLGLTVQFRRWKYLVESNSAHYNLKDLVPSFFAGFAFRIMIPGGHAEISKVFLLPGKKSGKMVAFGMEKFFQTYIKIVLIFAVLPLSFPEYWIYCLPVLAGLILLYIFLPRISVLKQLQEKDVNNHRVFAATLLFSLSLFVVMSIQYFILLNEVHSISFLDTMHTVVYLWGAGVVPISISGLGIREGLAVYFLEMHGFPAAYAVATSLFLFTINTIVPAIIGAIFIYIRRSDFKEMKNTVRSTRQMINSIRNGKKEKQTSITE